MSAHEVVTDYGTGAKKLSFYIIGIVLCVFLTIIPFYYVMYPTFSRSTTFLIIYAAATLQLFVQVTCFLRLNTRTSQSKMNTMSFLFTLVVLSVIIGGSLWIMWNLNYNMM